ncbi:MAG: hypothetical protein AAGA99_00610 [Actinomycetota bacterium]
MDRLERQPGCELRGRTPGDAQESGLPVLVSDRYDLMVGVCFGWEPETAGGLAELAITLELFEQGHPP